MGHRLLARLRALWRGVVRPSQLDAEMDEEMRFHVEMQADRLIRERNLDPVEARRQAYVACRRRASTGSRFRSRMSRSASISTWNFISSSISASS